MILEIPVRFVGTGSKFFISRFWYQYIFFFLVLLLEIVWKKNFKNSGTGSFSHGSSPRGFSATESSQGMFQPQIGRKYCPCELVMCDSGQELTIDPPSFEDIAGPKCLKISEFVWKTNPIESKFTAGQRVDYRFGPTSSENRTLKVWNCLFSQLLFDKSFSIKISTLKFKHNLNNTFFWVLLYILKIGSHDFCL